MNRKIIIGIIVFFLFSISIFAFATTNNGGENEDTNEQENQNETLDTTAPVIILNGDDVVYINEGRNYTELGATALDDVDGDLTSAIVITGSVNTSVVGKYTITYTVVDAAGNTSSVTRTVYVSDRNAPVISLNGSDEMTIEVFSTYTEPGAAVVDNYDNNLNVVITGTVDTTKLGVYKINYNATDSSGNKAIALVRTVNVVDTVKPVITLTGDSEVTLEVHSTYTEEYATALDNYDGDLTSSIITTNSSVNTNIVGTYTVTYNVADSSGNNADEVTRTINVVDTTAPHVILHKGLFRFVQDGAAYTYEIYDPFNINIFWADAWDNYDGYIPFWETEKKYYILENSDWVLTSTINTQTVNQYKAEYKATDNAGNFGLKTMYINVVDTESPTIDLVKSPNVEWTNDHYTLTINATDNAPTDLEYRFDNGFGDFADWSSANTKDYYNEGVRTITGEVKDASGNTNTDTVVIKIDKTNPTIVSNVLGDIELGSSFTNNEMLNFIVANDSLSGIDTSSIKYNGLNSGYTFNSLGYITLNYSVKDNAGNIRYRNVTFHVVDTKAPAIDLTKSPDVEWTNDHYTLTINATDNNPVGLTYRFDNGYGSFTSWSTNNTKDYYNEGIRTITAQVKDASGNIATDTIVIKIDKTAPVITLNGDVAMTVSYGSTFNDPGAVVNDGSPLIVGGDTVDTSVVGTYVITYDATDQAGNHAAQVTRTVQVVFVGNAPEITITGNNPVDVWEGTTYTDQGATASDVEDGSLTGSIQVTNNVNTSVPGTYEVEYSVTDSNGNVTTETRIVNVIEDDEAPLISGTTPVYVEYMETWSDPGVVVTDNSGITLTAIVGGDTVDTSVQDAHYYVTYNATDLAGNSATEFVREVIVVTTKPVITLNGSSSISIEKGQTYSDSGAEAEDYTGATYSVITSDSVNTSLVGIYTLRYNYTDFRGVAADQITRTVEVTEPAVDTTAPTITVHTSKSPLLVGYNNGGNQVIDNQVPYITAEDLESTNVVITYTVRYKNIAGGNSKVLGIWFTATNDSGLSTTEYVDLPGSSAVAKIRLANNTLYTN